MFLMDTNVISELMKKNPEEDVLRWAKEQIDQKKGIHVSAFSKAEIESGIYRLLDSNKKSMLISNAESFFAGYKGLFYNFDEQSASHYARIRAETQKAGRNIDKIDNMIAAIAVQHKLILATRNIKDFAGIHGLEVINPWRPKKEVK